MTSPFNQQVIAELSASLISRIKGLIVAGMTFEQAYSRVNGSSIAGRAVWDMLTLNSLSPGCIAARTKKASPFTQMSACKIMNHSSLLSLLRSLRKTLDDNIPDINCGGCGVVASLVGEKLEALGLPVDVVTEGDEDYTKPSNIRHNVSNKADPKDWDRNGLSRAHLAVRFRSFNGKLYCWDSDGLYRGGKWFGIDNYLTDSKLGEGLTVEETKAMSSTPDGWNRCFDREYIPMIEHLVNQHFKGI